MSVDGCVDYSFYRRLKVEIVEERGKSGHLLELHCLQGEMKGVSFSLKLFLFLTTGALIKRCAARPKKLYLELQNSSSELEVASLNYALEQSNANTSQLNNPFVLELRNSSEKKNLFNYASALAQQNVVALIEAQQDSNIPVCVLSMFTGIPLIRLHSNHDYWSKCEHVGVSLSASYSSYARATVQLLETFHWSKVAVLYEVRYVYEASSFQTYVSDKTTVHTIQLHRQGNETVESVVSKAIKELSKLKISVVLLYADGMYRQKLLSEERSCDCMDNFIWILQNHFPLNITAPSADKVVGFRLPRKLNQKSKQYEDSLKSKFNNAVTDLFTLKENVVLAHDAGQMVAQALAVVSTEKDWGQFFNSTSNRTSLTSQMKKIQLEGITGMIQFDEAGLRSSVELDVMNLRNNSPVTIGTWKSDKLIMSKDVRQNVEPTGDALKLEGKRLRVVTVEGHPFIITKRDSTGNITYEGYCIDLLDKLASTLKFTYDIYPSPDGAYGAEINGRWTGVVGELVRKKADLAAAPLTVTEIREKVVDFTVAYMYFTSNMIMKKKSAAETDFLQFMMPFDIPVWVMLLVCLLVVSCATFVLNYFSPFGYKDDSGRGTSSEFDLLNSFWFSLACMLQQGGDNTPKALSGRVLAGCYWFCILILVSTYTANLAAFFTVKNVDQPIKDLNGALNSDYKVGVTLGNAYYSFFQTSKYELYERTWQHMKTSNSIPQDFRQALEWVRNDKYIHIDDGPILEYETNKEPCDLVTLPALSMEEGLGFALQSDNPFVKDFSLEILSLRQDGFLDQLRRKWWDNASKCPKEDDDALSGKRIGLESMAGVYIVLSGGLLLSFIVLGVEIYWHKKGKEKTKNHLQSLSNKRTIRVSPKGDISEPPL